MATESLTAPRRANLNPVLGGVGRLLGALLIAVLFPFLFGLRLSNFAWMGNLANMSFLGRGLIATLTTSIVAILLSLPLATLLALARFARARPQRYLSAAFIEVIRAVPILLIIIYVYRRFPGIDAPGRLTLPGILGTLFGSLFSKEGLAVVVALTIYTTVVNAELIRSGLASLERGQFEAARSLGMSYAQMMRLVVLPQTYRRILPALIAQFTTLVKDTSLGLVIGFVELTRAARILYQQPAYLRDIMAILYVTALIYFVINYILGKISESVQRRSGGNQRLQAELEAGV
jgi:His/Glu/Gln/Arg/opine family amino acid ABC transporter permease subunit